MALLGTLLATFLLLSSPAGATPPTVPLEADLAGHAYPHTVQILPVAWQGRRLDLAYMDVAPTTTPSGVTVLLLHGKNFSGAYWADTIEVLTAAGHRVVVPDQIGFGRSSKPTDVQYSVHAMVDHTVGLLDHLQIEQVVVVGHSMGGMVAVRFALDATARTDALVLMNPIGLEDWRRLTPYRTVDAWVARNRAATPEGIRAYMRDAYFDGQWAPSYEPLVALQAGWAVGPDAGTLAIVSALHYDMIYSQPVVHELADIRVPTLLIIGERDRTALNKDLVSDAVRAQLGRYDRLGKAAKAAIPRARLVALPGVGHLPQVEAPARTFEALLEFLAR